MTQSIGAWKQRKHSNSVILISFCIQITQNECDYIVLSFEHKLRNILFFSHPWSATSFSLVIATHATCFSNSWYDFHQFPHPHIGRPTQKSVCFCGQFTTSEQSNHFVFDNFVKFCPFQAYVVMKPRSCFEIHWQKPVERVSVQHPFLCQVSIAHPTPIAQGRTKFQPQWNTLSFDWRAQFTHQQQRRDTPRVLLRHLHWEPPFCSCQKIGSRVQELNLALFTNSAGTRHKFFSDRSQNLRIPQGRRDACHSPFGNFSTDMGRMCAREACLMTCCVVVSFFVMCRCISFLWNDQILQHLHTWPSKHVRGSGSAPSPSVIRATEESLPHFLKPLVRFGLHGSQSFKFFCETTWSLRTTRVGNE